MINENRYNRNFSVCQCHCALPLITEERRSTTSFTRRKKSEYDDDDVYDSARKLSRSHIDMRSPMKFNNLYIKAFSRKDSSSSTGSDRRPSASWQGHFQPSMRSVRGSAVSGTYLNKRVSETWSVCPRNSNKEIHERCSGRESCISIYNNDNNNNSTNLHRRGAEISEESRDLRINHKNSWDKMERSCSLASIKETNNSRTNSKDNSINNVNKYHKDSTGSLHRYASNMDKHALFKKHGHNDTDRNSPIREDNSRQRHDVGCNGTPNDRERKRDLHRQYIPVKPHVEANKGTYLNKDIKSQRNSSIKMYSSRRSTTNSEKMSRRNKELESARRQSDNSDVIVRDDNPKHRDWSAEVAQCEESRRVNLKNIESINSIIKQYKAQLDTFDETHEFEITELKELVNKKSLLQKEYTDRISKANAEIAFSKEYILYCDSEKNNIKDGQVLSKVNQCLAFIPSCNSRGANVSDCLSVTCSEIGRSMGLIEHSMEVGQTSKKEEKENFISNSQHNLSKLSLEFPAEDEIEKRKTCKDINQSCCAVDMSNVEPSMTSFGSPRRDEGLLNTTGDDSSQCICDNSEDVKHLSSMVTHIVLDATPKGNPIPASQRGIRELVKAIRKLNTLPPRADVNRYNII